LFLIVKIFLDLGVGGDWTKHHGNLLRSLIASLPPFTALCFRYNSLLCHMLDEMVAWNFLYRFVLNKSATKVCKISTVLAGTVWERQLVSDNPASVY
jgi:hypothetical protein